MQPVFSNTVCRLCLKVDVKGYKLGISHQTFIENMLKIKELNYIRNDNDTVCYICMALLTKSYKFIQMVWNAQALLSNLLKKNKFSVNEMMLKLIDRNECGLNPLNLKSFVLHCEINPTNVITTENIETEKDYEHGENISIKISSYNEKNNVDAQVKEALAQKQKAEVDKNKFTTNKQIITNNDTLVGDNMEPKQNPIKRAANKTQKIVYHDEESSDSESSSSSSSKDDEYRPDSSRSDDSYDSFDDDGKPIREPEREYPRKCDHCNYEVPKKTEHFRHYLYVHPNIEYPYGAARVPCSICGRVVSANNIEKHKAKHIDRQVKCTYCDKTFRHQQLVRRHIANVHKHRNYICDYCSKPFKTRLDIGLHIRTHTGEKPYKCHICGWRCAHGGNVLAHIRNKHKNCGDEPKKRQQAQKNRSNKTDADKAVSGDEQTRGKRKNTKNVRKRENNSSRIKKKKTLMLLI